MKFKVIENIPVSKLTNYLPIPYREMVSLKKFASETISVIVFRHERRDVIISRVVKKAIEKIRERHLSGVISIGGDFTVEGRNFLKSEGIEFFSLSEFGWTDESCQSIRQV